MRCNIFELSLVNANDARRDRKRETESYIDSKKGTELTENKIFQSPTQSHSHNMCVYVFFLVFFLDSILIAYSYHFIPFARVRAIVCVYSSVCTTKMSK